MRAIHQVLGLVAFSANYGARAAEDAPVDSSIVYRGEAFWICRSGAEGVACGPRREPALNDSGVYCGVGLCCPGAEASIPFICKAKPCTQPYMDEEETCTCARFAAQCAAVDGSSHCVDVPLTGRLSGAACVCKPPLIADQHRQKCVPDVCSGNACGTADAVKFCYPSKVATSPAGQIRYEATCICADNYVLNPETRRCVPAPLDRCKTERPCGPEEAVNTCRENPMTGKFICTCKTGYVMNSRDNTCQQKCTPSEAALCGTESEHDADGCSIGLDGRDCACKKGYRLRLDLRTCVPDTCYEPTCGWYEGVQSCTIEQDQPVCRCAATFQKNLRGACLPECPLGWRYNQNREMCEVSNISCPVTDCGSEEAVDQCLVDKDSGTLICKCKAGYALDTATGQCAAHPACASDTCQVFGPDAVCVSDGSTSNVCQCISNLATIGNETTTVVKPCDPVECPDPSICGTPEGVRECTRTASGHTCSCTALYKLDSNSGQCVLNSEFYLPDLVVPEGSLRVSATRAPLQFTISAIPCVSASFNFSKRSFEATTYDSVSAYLRQAEVEQEFADTIRHLNGHTHTTSMTLPYHPGAFTGAAFIFRMSPAPGGFDISFVYELRPNQYRQVIEQTSIRVYSDSATRKAARDAGGGVLGAVAAAVASARQRPCEVAYLDVTSATSGGTDTGRFENLKTLLNQYPTADASATKFPEADPTIPKPEEPDPESIAFPSPSPEAEEPPEPETVKPLPYPPPTDPDLTVPPPSDDEQPDTQNVAPPEDAGAS